MPDPDEIRSDIIPPPEWAIKEAVRRSASAVAGHQVQLEDIEWRMATPTEDLTNPDGSVIPAGERHVLIVVREMPDKANFITLRELTSIARNIALQAH